MGRAARHGAGPRLLNGAVSVAVALRALSLNDAEAVVGLIAARNRADFGETDYFDWPADDLRERWRLEETKLATDAWVALEGVELVGYAHLDAERDLASLVDESCVHPDRRARGIGTALLDRAEARAREARLARFHVHVVNDDGRRLVERRGHRLVRYHWRMEIDLPTQPPEPTVPDGYALRHYRPGADDAPLHALLEHAFAAHWEFTPERPDDWLRARTSRSDYRPALWQVAEADGELAGAALCFGDGGLGWVLELGVSMRHRGCGLGVALLQSGFRALAAQAHTRGSRSTRRTRRVQRGSTSASACG